MGPSPCFEEEQHGSPKAGNTAHLHTVSSSKQRINIMGTFCFVKSILPSNLILGRRRNGMATVVVLVMMVIQSTVA
jgi:hypothetical protein